MSTRVAFALKIQLIALLIMSPICFADEAVDRFRTARVKARAEAYLEEARQEVERGAYFRAIRLLSQAMNKGAGGVKTYELRARAYVGIGSKDLALQDLNHVVASRPSDPSVYVLRADASNSMKYFDQAISDYNRALELDPVLVDAFLGRGIAYAAIEKYELSIRDFELALRMDQHNFEALYNMGLICLMAGLPQAGRDFVNKAIEVDSDPAVRDQLLSILAAAPERSDYEDRKGGIKGIFSELSKQEKEESIYSSNPMSKLDPNRISTDQIKIDNSGQLFTQSDSRQLLAKIGKEDFSGKSSGYYMGMKWSASFRIKGKDATVTLKVMSPSGNQETHYCRGSYDNGVVEGSDQLGFRFSGRVTDEFRLVGSLTSADGKNISVDAALDQ